MLPPTVRILHGPQPTGRRACDAMTPLSSSIHASTHRPHPARPATHRASSLSHSREEGRGGLHFSAKFKQGHVRPRADQASNCDRRAVRSCVQFRPELRTRANASTRRTRTAAGSMTPPSGFLLCEWPQHQLMLTLPRTRPKDGWGGAGCVLPPLCGGLSKRQPR